MHLLQHLVVFEYFLVVYVTALDGGVFTVTDTRGDACAIAMLELREAAQLRAELEGARLRDTTGPTASVTSIKNT